MVKGIKLVEENKLITQFGKDPNQISHTFRHIDALGLDRKVVRSAIEKHLENVCAQIMKGAPFNQIIQIEGIKIQYTAFKLEDGILNIGRIHAIK